jgi:hypothetical protein
MVPVRSGRTRVNATRHIGGDVGDTPDDRPPHTLLSICSCTAFVAGEGSTLSDPSRVVSNHWVQMANRLA